MDIKQLGMDADAVRGRGRETPRHARPELQSNQGAEALWLGDTAAVDFGEVQRQTVTQRITVTSPSEISQARVEPTLGEQSPKTSGIALAETAQPPEHQSPAGGSTDTFGRPTAANPARAEASPAMVPSSTVMESPGPKDVDGPLEPKAELGSEVKPAEAADQSPSAEAARTDGKKRFSEKAFVLLAGLVTRLRAKSAAKKAAKKQQEEDEKNKKASVRKRNFALPITGGLLLLVGGIILVKSLLNGIEKEAGIGADASANASASTAAAAAASTISDATALLTGAGPAPRGEPAQTAQEGTAPSASTPEDASPRFSPPASPSGNDDPYLAKMMALKNKLNNDPKSGTAPTGLPAEIENQHIPTSSARRGTPHQQRNQQIFTAEPPMVIPDEIEASSHGQEARRDPLERVAVVGRMNVEKGGMAPYSVTNIRETQVGNAAFIYFKNSDPLLTGRWYQIGDQTDDGWTVVSISRSTVNVVSPRGRVFEIN